MLAIVLALWINLAVQPCAMAMGTDGDCPHCPPAAEHDMTMAHGHHDTDVAADCATLGVECGEIDDFGLDSRGSTLKSKDKLEFVALLPPPLRDSSLLPTAATAMLAAPPESGLAARPLHLLNCVFLD